MGCRVILLDFFVRRKKSFNDYCDPSYSSLEYAAITTQGKLVRVLYQRGGSLQFLIGKGQSSDLQVGQCGIEIGSSFLDLISLEHGLDERGFVHPDASCNLLEGVNVFFAEKIQSNFIPRTIFADLDPIALFPYKNSVRYGEEFNNRNLICGKRGAANIWARGHTIEESRMLESIMECIQKEVEDCDKLQGFQLVHALGGGTGSGLGTLLLSKIRDDFPGRLLNTYSVLPSPSISETVVEPYNAILSINELLDNSNQTFCFDNEALYNICRKTLSLSYPDFKDVNELISVTMSGITACLRFEGQFTLDLRQLLLNMCPFPKCHFLMPGFAPLTSRLVQEFSTYTVSQLAEQMFDARNMMLACDPKEGKYLTATAVFRGKMSIKEIDQQMVTIRNNYKDYFVDWIPRNFSCSLYDVVPRGLRMSVTFLGNSTTIQNSLQRLSTQFTTMFKKNAFLHWYTDEGIETDELLRAESNVSNLAAEYSRYDEEISEVSEEYVE